MISFIVAKTDTPILDMMSYSWGIISGSFLAPYVISLYWKKLTRKGAWSGIGTGFVIAIVPALCKIIVEISGMTTVSDGFMGAMNTVAGYGPQFACMAAIMSIIVCIIVSKIAPEIDETEKKATEFFYNGVGEKE